MSLVNISLKFWSLNMAYMQIFLLKKMWVAFAFAKATHIFSAKYMWIRLLTRTVNTLTTNKLVKLTMLWTTGSRSFIFLLTLHGRPLPGLCKIKKKSVIPAVFVATALGSRRDKGRDHFLALALWLLLAWTMLSQCVLLRFSNTKASWVN